YKEVDQARSTVFSILAKCDEPTSIALYMQFADLEIELRQFKQATKVLEQAVVTHPLSPVLWKRYVGFCLERQKHSNAKKLVVRAIELLPKATEYFTKLPETLPITPECPHLLFDPLDTSGPLPPNISYHLEDFKLSDAVRINT
ncbi:hypothetical protein DYB37_013448, partial [Aphanomyces astaci]